MATPGFFGGLGSLFSGGTTPEEQQRAALFQAGLATLANAQQPGASFGGSLFSGFQAGAGLLQQAQQNAFQSKRLQAQEEREARIEKQETDRIKIAQAEQSRKDRERGASVATRVATGIGNAKDNPLGYFDVVRRSPEIQELAKLYGFDPEGITTPEQVLELGRTLGAQGGIGAEQDPAKTEPLEAIVGPDGKALLVPRSQAVNKTPFIKPAAGVTVNNNIPSGDERKGATLAVRLEGALQGLSKISQLDPGALTPSLPEKAVGSVSEMGANALRSPLRQQAAAAQLDALDAALTLSTGAAYTKEQLEGLRNSYFPQVGDDPATVAAKQQRFEALVNSAYIAAGRAAPQVDEALKPRGADGKVSSKLIRNPDGSFTYTP